MVETGRKIALDDSSLKYFEFNGSQLYRGLRRSQLNSRLRTHSCTDRGSDKR
jgi:hypothetical protein